MDYSSPSVKALMGKHTQESDPVKVIKQIAQEKVRFARRSLWPGPPFDPRFLASILGMTCKGKEMPDHDDARLVPEAKGRLSLEFNTNKPETRQNYSIAHEVVHTFFPDYREQIQERKLNPEHRDKDVEKLCEIGAAELLMPNPEFFDDMTEAGGVCIDSFEYLRNRYRASREATANRMVRSANKPCAVVYYRFKLKPMEKRQLKLLQQPGLFPIDGDLEKQFLKKLRVDYSIASGPFNFFVPKDKSLDEDSPLVEVALRGTSFKGTTGINLDRNKIVDFKVDAVSYPCDHSWKSPNGVIAFIFPVGREA